MSPAFLDTNVILRHLLADHAEQSPKATAYLARVEQGEIQVYIADTVIFEAVFTLERHYHQPKEQRSGTAMLPLIELPGVMLPGKRHFRQVFDLYVTSICLLRMPTMPLWPSVSRPMASSVTISTSSEYRA